MVFHGDLGLNVDVMVIFHEVNMQTDVNETNCVLPVDQQKKVV